MFFLQGQRKPIDDRAQYLQKFRDSVMPLSFIDKLEKDVVDGTSNKGSQIEEFAVDAMESGLEEIAFSGVLAVKELEKVEHKSLVDVALGNVGVEIGALDESQEKLINNLEMWPREFKNRLVFLGVKRVSNRVDLRWNRSKKIGGKLEEREKGPDCMRAATHHIYHLWVYILRYYATLSCNIFKHFMKSLCLDLFAFDIGAGIVKVEQNATLVQLLDEKTGTIFGRHI